MSRPERLAVIEVGTKGIRLLVVERRAPPQGLEVLNSKGELGFLGEGLETNAGRMRRDNIDRSLRHVSTFLHLAREQRPERTILVGTEVFRRAANVEEFTDRLPAGLELRILTPEEEAVGSFCAACWGFRDSFPPDGRVVLIDLGGGSLEVVGGLQNTPPQPLAEVSLRDMGTLALRETWRRCPDPARREAEFERALRASLDRHTTTLGVFGATGGQLLVAGLGSTICDSAWIVRGHHRKKYSSERVHGLTASRSELIGLRRQIQADPDRAAEELGVKNPLDHQLGLGALLLLLERLGVSSVTACGWGLRYGLAYAYLHEVPLRIPSPKQPSVPEPPPESKPTVPEPVIATHAEAPLPAEEVREQPTAPDPKPAKRTRTARGAKTPSGTPDYERLSARVLAAECEKRKIVTGVKPKKERLVEALKTWDELDRQLANPDTAPEGFWRNGRLPRPSDTPPGTGPILAAADSHHGVARGGNLGLGGSENAGGTFVWVADDGRRALFALANGVSRGSVSTPQAARDAFLHWVRDELVGTLLPTLADDAPLTSVWLVLHDFVRTQANEAVVAVSARALKGRQDEVAEVVTPAAVSGVVCLLDRGVLYTVSLGNSRAYLVTETRAEPLSLDGISEPHRLSLGHARWEREKGVLVPVAPSTPVLAPCAIQPGDCLVLASDGLHRSFRDEANFTERVRTLVLRESRPLPRVALDLIYEANCNDGRDNLSVVLARFPGET